MSDDLHARDARLAAEIDADVSVEHVATVYAEAFLGAAQSAGRTEVLLDEFASLLADVLDPAPKLEEILVSGLVSHEEKAGILDRTLGRQASPTLLNFLKVVSRHGRLDCLRAIHRQVRELYDQRRGLVQVQVSTATPLADDLARRLEDNLRAIVDGRPNVQLIVDPHLIGGIVVRVGDTVYDGSIATQLENMRKEMIDRSAHEIQSRRDRFRNSAGN